MRIKMRTILAGPNGCAQPGQVIDHPDGEQLVAAGFAVPADPTSTPATRSAVQTGTVLPPEAAIVAPPEAATISPRETTAARGRGGKGRG